MNPIDDRSRNPDREDIADEDAKFVAQLTTNFAPAPLSDVRRREFHRTLTTRIAAPRRAWRSTSMLLATAAAVALFAVPALFIDNGESDSPGGGAEAFAAAEWESRLFDSSEFLEADAFEDSDDLPDDYAAIAGLLLDG